MRCVPVSFLPLAGAVFVLAAELAYSQGPVSRPPFTIEQVRAYPFPGDVVGAADAPRIAWPFNEEGRRNLYVAQGPVWRARMVTSFADDDGQELTSIQLSRRGDRVVFARGGEHGGLWAGDPPNPASLPVPPVIQVWSVAFDSGPPRLLADGDYPALAPQGDRVAFVRGRQVWVVPADGSAPASLLFGTSGTISDLRWSPDGRSLAFVSSRGDHNFIGLFVDARSPIRWIAPATARDGSPRWSPDGERLAFVRRPGAGGPPDAPGDGTAGAMGSAHAPWGIWVWTAATGEARRVWQAPQTPRGSPPTTQGGTNLRYAAGGRVTYLSYEDGWPHLYSVADTGGQPLRLTTGAYMVEHASLSADGRSLVFSANIGRDSLDIDRRHLARVPVDRARVDTLTHGDGVESAPILLNDGTLVGISSTARRPPLPTVWPVGGRPPVLVGADRLPAHFPVEHMTAPQAVVFRSPDGLQIHAQRFEAKGGPARKPAIVFVHGGPQRQMLLGWHPADYYAATYAMNQYLAARGFVVLAVNYRLGIGYGYDFHRPRDAGTLGASEYQDVLAAADHLRADPRVDRARIGIYGGSYGGFLTALALARNSDRFSVGVDMHGVHNFVTDGGARFGGAA